MTDQETRTVTRDLLVAALHASPLPFGGGGHAGDCRTRPSCLAPQHADAIFAALAAATPEPARDGHAWDEADGMCPNCITPWKCNGPHLSDETVAGRRRAAANPPEPARDGLRAMAARWAAEAEKEPDYPGEGIALDTLRNCARELLAALAAANPLADPEPIANETESGHARRRELVAQARASEPDLAALREALAEALETHPDEVVDETVALVAALAIRGFALAAATLEPAREHDEWCDGSGSSAGSACCRLNTRAALAAPGDDALRTAIAELVAWAEMVSDGYAILRTEPPYTSTKTLKDRIAAARAALRSPAPGRDAPREDPGA